MFDPVDPKQSFPDLEHGILQYWKRENLFHRSVAQRSGSETFSFYDGPPFATGLPHYGHLLAGTIKDVIPRYQTMKGKRVERRFGWDCHGLPVENLVEKENDIQSKKDIGEKGVAWFNDLCRTSVLRYANEWTNTVERMGRWVDMDYDYRTMDADYMESIWWVFKEIYDKGLIYEGHKPMHICPRCVTPLSNFEVTQGYKDVTDLSVTARFEVKGQIKSLEKISEALGIKNNEKIFFLAWTTTPWTLPGNLFLAINPKEHYTLFRYTNFENPKLNGLYITSTKYFNDLYTPLNKFASRTGDGEDYKVSNAPEDYDIDDVTSFDGKDLLDITYTPLFPYFASRYPDAFKVVEGEFVTTEDGTGIVHIAPGFGEDDFQVGKHQEAELLQHVSMDGTFVPEVTDFAGMHVKPADDSAKTDRKIAEHLEGSGLLFEKKNYKHTYPHCWRCDSPLLNYATSSWFVAVEQIKDKMLANNAKTQWVPGHIRDGRFGNWLENARDWAISRNRFWGTPLPIWKSDDAGVVDVVGSRDELMQRARIRCTKITAVRHGESEGNLIPIYQAKEPGTDLTKRGKQQVQATADFLAKGTVDKIYCSPLARTQQTAQIIADATGAEVIVDDRLREVDFGDYEGKMVDMSDTKLLVERREKKFKEGRIESVFHLAGMEEWSSVLARMTSFFEEILPKHRSEHIVVVSHADPIHNIIHYFTKEDQFKLSNQPYPDYAEPFSFFWDHDTESPLDLHKQYTDTFSWPSTPESVAKEKTVDATFLRHGQTDWNLKAILQGRKADVPLNDTGKSQVEDVAKLLKGEKFDAIVCSTLLRATQTAEIVATELGMDIAEQIDLLDERDCGDWTGKARKEVPAFDAYPDDQRAAMIYATPPNGESLSTFLSRAKEAYIYLLKHYAGKRVLVVTHGGMLDCMRCIQGNLSYQETANLTAENCARIPLTLTPHIERIPDVLDCWFESGSMPYAQVHYPFALRQRGSSDILAGADGNTKHDTSVEGTLPTGFPADFIAEGLDQTRGWFYTLMVLSTALFDEPAFHNCVVNGIVLAKDGRKMSKKLRNYPDPLELTEQTGADAIRFTLMRSPAVRGEDMCFSQDVVEETVRSVLLPLWNSYSFFVTYANAANFAPLDDRRASQHPLDTWIKAEVQDLVNRMTRELDRYELSATCAELHDTIDALTNWYIRLSRRRFAGKGSIDAAGNQLQEEEQLDAFQTLYDVLLTLSQLLAPFCPFISEAIYLNLVPQDHGSVHLTDWPEVRDLSKNETLLLQKTRLQRQIVSLGLKARAQQNMKVRQPLASATIALPPAILKDLSFSDEDRNIMRTELNVKELHFTDDPGSLGESYVQVDARAVGPRLGKRVQEVIQAGKAGDFEQLQDGSIRILEETLTPDEASIVYRATDESAGIAADRGVVVSIDAKLTKQLELEGIARDIIRTVQKHRKDDGLSINDTITLHIEGADDVLDAFTDLITQETKANLAPNAGEVHTLKIDDRSISISFVKTNVSAA